MLDWIVRKYQSIALLCMMLRMLNPRGNEENESVNGSVLWNGCDDAIVAAITAVCNAD